MDFTKEQKQAIDVRGMSVAVSAAAGSGKTAVLTRRIIERVCAPDGSGDISRILAVTFTKAAASEITARLSRALNEKLASDPANRHIARQSLLVSSAKISTVHRFCLDIIRENFEKTALPSDFSVGDETKLKILSRKVMEDLIDDCFEGEAPDCDDIENFALFSDTFGSPKGTEPLAETALEIYEKLSCKEKFIDSVNEYIQMYKNIDAANFMESAWGMELSNYVRSFCAHYKKILGDAVSLAGVNEDYLPSIAGYSYDVNFIDLVLSLLEKSAGYEAISETLKSYSPPRLIFKRGAALDPKMEYFRSERNSFKKELRKMTDTYFSFSSDQIIGSARSTADRLREMKSFLSAFDKRFSEEKLRRHIISFADIEHFALGILENGENGSPSDVAIRIRDGFDEIYVDEYQDTNEVQNKIFSLISREDNLFCVGDVKQSIYGFRGAEPSIFEKILSDREKYEEGSDAKKTKIFLSKNFRSSNEIIDFCNGVFGSLMNAGGEKYGADEKLNPGLEETHGKVRVFVTDELDESAPTEPEAIAAMISSMAKDGRRFSDFAILVRSSTHAAKFENALEKMNIPCKNTVDSDFFESPEVLLALSVLNVIDNPARDVYLAATLKSPLFGVTLDEMIYMRRMSDGSLYDALVSFTSQTGFKKGERFLAFLNKFRLLSQSLSCDKLIWQMYSETGILSLASADADTEKYEAEQAKANLIQLYNYSLSIGKNTYHGLYDFITLINDLLDRKEKINLSQFKTSGDSVVITTIHKSKGLEYPVCFVSGTGYGIFKGESSENTFVGKLGVSTRLLHPSGFGKEKSIFYCTSLLPENRAKLDEELRILYVALTRAREKLIITAKGDKKGGGIIDFGSEYISEYSLLKCKKYIEMINLSGALSLECVEADNDIESTEILSEEKPGKDTLTLTKARAIVNSRLSFRYPYRQLADVPSKVAVSELYPDLLDDPEPPKESNFDYTPEFLRDDGGSSGAAERGSATHTFMQFFDFDRVEKNGVEAEIGYLAAHKFIFESDAEKIDVRGIEKFLKSDVAKKIRKSTEVFREKRFILAFDAADFSEDEKLKATLDGEKILVQGVIDVAYRDDDGKIVLIDYKTDHFSRGTPRETVIETLKERHTRQLTYYRRACTELFGEVSHVYVYSFAIGELVEI